MKPLNRCAVCGEPIPRIKQEHESFYQKRTVCGDACRNIARSRAQRDRLQQRLTSALATWTPGVAPSTHAQRFSIKTEALREGLRAAGREGEVGRPKARKARRKPALPKAAEDYWPTEDRLLARLVEVYGERRLASSSAQPSSSGTAPGSSAPKAVASSSSAASAASRRRTVSLPAAKHTSPHAAPKTRAA